MTPRPVFLSEWINSETSTLRTKKNCHVRVLLLSLAASGLISIPYLLKTIHILSSYKMGGLRET